MKIGVNLLFLIPNEVGGSEVYARGLLNALRDRSAELVLFTNEENHATFDGFAREKIPVNATDRKLRIMAEQFTLPKAVERTGVDVLLSLGYTSPLRARVPKVTATLDMQYRTVPDGFNLATRFAHHVFVDMAARTSKVILTLSEFSRGEITRYLGIPESRIVIAPPGIPPLATPTDRVIDEPYILTIANTYSHKNTSALVRALDDVEEPHKLVLVGQAREGEPPPHPRLIRKHRVSDEELAALYRDAALFVSPSLYEGFGLPLLEAMSARCRVVSARCGAAPEVVGDAATFIDDERSPESIAAAINSALTESEEERKAFIEKGFERAKEFTWKRTAECTLEAIAMATTQS